MDDETARLLDASLGLRQATDAELVAELERRARDMHPVTARCPNCTRTDALVTVMCAENHGDAGGLAYFPLEPRRRHLIAMRLEAVFADVLSHGLTLDEVLPFVSDERRYRALGQRWTCRNCLHSEREHNPGGASGHSCRFVDCRCEEYQAASREEIVGPMIAALIGALADRLDFDEEGLWDWALRDTASVTLAGRTLDHATVTLRQLVQGLPRVRTAPFATDERWSAFLEGDA